LPIQLQTNQAKELQTQTALRPDQEQEKYHATSIQAQKILSIYG